MIVNKEQLKDAIREVLYEFFDSRQGVSNDSELIDVKQASAMLNLARATVYEKTSLKLLPHYKKGKKIMFKRSELLAWLESGKVDVIKDGRQRAIDYMQSHDRRR
jgi:excisionase family DNA binding protein